MTDCSIAYRPAACSTGRLQFSNNQRAILQRVAHASAASGRPAPVQRAPVPPAGAFDVLFADGEDLRPLPLATRKAVLKRLLRGREDLIVVDWIAGEGIALYQEVCRLDLEGIVAKRLADPYGPETKWFKVLNRAYSQKEGRGELFERR